MNRSSTALAVSWLVLVPIAAESQVGLGARVGTLGLGGEAALGLTERLVVRGGFGVTPLDVDATFSGVDVTLSLPTWYNAGVDFYLNGALRVGGGLLFKPDDPEATGEFTTAQEIGGTIYNPGDIGTLRGVVDSGGQAPYVLLGFGKHTSPGVGLFLDLGVAFLSDPDVRLDAEGGTLEGDPGLRASLDQEAAEFEDDMQTYLRFWPILSLGLRLGVG